VFHTSLADRVARVNGDVPGLRLLIEVDDGPAPDGTAHVDGAVAYEAIQASTARAARVAVSDDDVYIFDAGGTNGMRRA